MTETMRQTGPDRLEIRSGGGCVSLFGIPFILAGIFLILVALQIIPMSNAEEVPFWAWPVMLLMGLVFVAFSSGLVFGRTRVIVDAGAGRVTRERWLLVRVKQEAHSLLDYQAVALSFTAGDSDSADSYGVALQGQPGRPDLALATLYEYGPALSQAGSVAQTLRLPLVDTTTDHQAVVAFDQVGVSLPNRLGADDERLFERVDPPATLQSEVEIQGRSVRIRIAHPPLTRFSLLAFLFPVAILLYFGPKLLRFFSDTETPPGIQICAAAFILLFFVGLPLIEIANGSLRARRGASILTASPAGITIEQRGAWRSRTKTIPASDILGLDYSTPESAVRSAEHAAVRQVGSADGLPVTQSRWLGRLMKGKGVAIKTREGLVQFGAGLPGPEARYLCALIARALAGSRG